MRKYTPEERIAAFWNKIDQSGGEDVCWLWTGAINSSGYGHFRVADKIRGAHQIVYDLLVAAIPDGLYVLHTCDNRACCNPKHLFLGTHQDNMDDMAQKGRRIRLIGNANPAHQHPEIRQGERNGRAKLTVDEVLDIRRRYAEEHISQTALGKDYGISQTVVSMIVLRKIWDI